MSTSVSIAGPPIPSWRNTRLSTKWSPPGFLFEEWVKEFDYEEPFSSIHCLEIIRKEEGPFCLAIGEVSTLNEMAEKACSQLTKLVMSSPTIIFLGGTLRADWEKALKRSGLPSRFLSLAPLSKDQVSNILDTLQPPHAKYFKDWRISTHLRALLLQIGGVPRLLDDFVKNSEKKFRNYEPPWDWKDMDASLEELDRAPELSVL